MAQPQAQRDTDTQLVEVEDEQRPRKQKQQDDAETTANVNKEGNVFAELDMEATQFDDAVETFDLDELDDGISTQQSNVSLSGTVKLIGGGNGDNRERDVVLSSSKSNGGGERPQTIHWKVMTPEEVEARVEAPPQQATGEKSSGKSKRTAVVSTSTTPQGSELGTPHVNVTPELELEVVTMESPNNNATFHENSTNGILASTSSTVDIQFETTQIIEIENAPGSLITATISEQQHHHENNGEEGEEDTNDVVVVVVGENVEGVELLGTETGTNNNGDMDKLPIELAQGETLFSLDGIDDTESSGGNSQTCEEKRREDAGQHLEEVKTATGEVIRLKKPRNEEKTMSESLPGSSSAGVQSPHRTDDGSFPCTLCSQRFTRKLFLNNHMEEQHGVKYVFTERGRKVKLVRIPKNYDPQNMDDLDPSIRKLIKKSAGCHDLSKVVGVVTVHDPDEESVAQVTESIAEDKKGAGEKENEEGVECGFLVDRINTAPYQKALSRGEIPFCAFSPISTQDLYLLRIQDCPDSTRHMLVPASKEDVFSTPGALKKMDEQEADSDDSVNYKVAIVAIARQIYSEEEKQLVVSVDPPLKRDREKITNVKFLSLDKFADFAFLGFDGNVDEYAKNNNVDGEKECIIPDQNKSQIPVDALAKAPSPIRSPFKEKSPPRARRGRGGRRRASRKSPPMPSTSSSSMRNHHQRQDQPLPPSFSLPHAMPGQYSLLQEVPSTFNSTYVKMEHGDGQNHPFLTQVSIPQTSDNIMHGQAQLTAPMDYPVPMPVSEVTVSTFEPGMEAVDEQTNHDIITIALDQLLPMTSGDGFGCNGPPERSSRGGRRPGRKPGRKPAKEREVCENDENSTTGQRHHLNSDGTVPKRRGRPPKNRALMQVAGPEADNSTVDADDYESIMLGKRMKFHTLE